MPVSEVNPDEFIASAAIGACGRGALWLQAMAVFHQTPRAETDVGCYDALMTVLEGSSQWPKALMLYNNLLEKKLQPDGIGYSVAIKAALRARNNFD